MSASRHKGLLRAISQKSTETVPVRSALFLALWVAMASQAQEGANESQKGARMLEEVVVTAQRREESLQETEISMSVFDASDLEELGVTQYGDISLYTPNVTITENPSGNAGYTANIRGISNGETLLNFDPKVSLYLDGVLLAKNVGSGLDILDLERVEVLRGPQGTLYGRNTIGGAINLISKKPEDELGMKLSATLGNYSQRDIKGVFNIPLVGREGVLSESTESSLNLRATVASLNRDGFQTNHFPGHEEQELDNRDREVATLQLAWVPTESVSVLYAYDYTKVDEAAKVPLITGTNPGVLMEPFLTPFIVDDTPKDVSVNSPMPQKLDAEGHSLTVDVDLGSRGILGDVSLTSITALRKFDSLGGADADGTPVDLISTLVDQDYEMFTQELRLVGSTMDSRLDYVLGAYLMKEEGDVANDLFLDFGLIRRNTFLGDSRRSATRSSLTGDFWAVYGETTYHLNDRVDLTAGLRYTEEDRTMEKASTFTTADNPNPTFNALPKADKTWDNWSPMIGISYQWTDDLMVYGKISTGYNSGGFNVRASNDLNFTEGFDEETVTAYELGWKSMWFENRLMINGAVFFSDYEDYQANTFDPRTSSNNIQNAAQAEITGLELEILAQPTDALEIGINYGHQKAKFTDFVDANGVDMSGNTFTRTPEDNLLVFGRYEIIDLPIGDLIGRVDWSWQDDMTWLTIVPEPNSQKAYSVVNARLTLENIKGLGDGSFKVSLWGKNLADKSYNSSGVNHFFDWGYDTNVFAPPRTYGVDVTFEL